MESFKKGYVGDSTKPQPFPKEAEDFYSFYWNVKKAEHLFELFGLTADDRKVIEPNAEGLLKTFGIDLSLKKHNHLN